MLIDNECWLMHEPRLNGAISLLNNIDFSVFNAGQSENEKRAKEQFLQQSGYQVKDGIAYINMSGVMMKNPEPCMSMFGESSVSTLAVRKALRKAVQDQTVSAVNLLIDSPGGNVNGSFDLAEDVRVLKSRKPIYAYASDQMTSAAYLVGSQATKLFANENALIGSVGVMSVLRDTSKAYDEKGIKVHVIKTGDEKAIGVDGTVITADQLEVSQRLADTYFQLFKDNIKMGRPKVALKDIKEAQCYLAKDALEKHLIDGITDLNGLHAIAKGAKNIMAGEETDLIELSDADKNSPTRNTMSDSMIAFLADNAIDENKMMMFAKIGMTELSNTQNTMIKMGVLALGISEDKLKIMAKDQSYDMLQLNIEAYTEIAKAKGLAGGNGSRQTVPQNDNIEGYGTSIDASKVNEKDLVNAATKTKLTDLSYQAL